VREAIFRAFRQADIRQAAIGSGLGLAFCRLAVFAHGGSIRLESPETGGCRFVLRLPVGAT
jgi:signal transduction histidine kinase